MLFVVKSSISPIEVLPMPSQPSSLDRLLQAIDLDDDEAAEALISQLRRRDEAGMLAVIIGADEGSSRRWWGLRGLAAVGREAAVPMLVVAILNGDEGERAVAALALGHVHARAGEEVREFLPLLALGLADESGLVRQTTADGLALCGEDAVPVLVEALESEHEGVRVRAAAALRKLQSMQAAGAMYQHLNDPNHLVRLYAYETLDAMGLLTNILLRR